MLPAQTDSNLRSTIDRCGQPSRRARRRPRDGGGLPARAGGGQTAAPGAVDVEDVVIVFGAGRGRSQLRDALETELGDAVDRPDTPARFERALATLLAGRGEPGQPRVLRRPAPCQHAGVRGRSTSTARPGDQRAVRAAGRSGVFTA